ncbi:MAG TPA: glycosyltransferase [Tepidisphaeraceae bacterium]|nr:glycosyltransferase [Tepidisphaeraceae bacterium]
MPPTLPTVSVIMPAYNAKRYVEEAIRSVLAQTFGDFEFIVVDDGSTDGTLAILRRLAAEDARIIVISRPNTGIVGALNDGIAQARGELLARMDADDICLPRRFERQVAYLREHPDCVAVGAFVETIDPYGSVLDRLVHETGHEAIDRELMSGRGFAMVHPAVMMRAQDVARTGGYRAIWQHSEDLDLFLRLAEIGRLHNIPEYLLRYRMHYQSANHLRHEQQRSIKHKLMAEAYARRGVTMPTDMEFNRRYPPPKFDQTCTWGWRALKRGNRDAARQHALDAIKMGPFKPAAWRLAVYAMRGR